MKTSIRILILATVALLLFPANAAAESRSASPSTTMLRYLPAHASMYVGINMNAMKGTIVYREAMALVTQQAQLSSFLELLREAAGFDLDKDLDTATLALPAISDPTKPVSEFAAALTGNFDREKIIEAMKKRPGYSESKKGELSIHKAGVQIAFPSDRTLVVAEGSSAYLERTWTAVVKEEESAARHSVIAQLIRSINTTASMWMTADASNLPQSGAAMDSTAMVFDFRRGLALEVHANMANDEAAEQAYAEMNALKSEPGHAGMLALFGAASLVNNLKVTRKDKSVILNTSMTNPEVEQAIARVKTMLVSGGSQLVPGQIPGGQPETSKPKRGADADFN